LSVTVLGAPLYVDMFTDRRASSNADLMVDDLDWYLRTGYSFTVVISCDMTVVIRV